MSIKPAVAANCPDAVA